MKTQTIRIGGMTCANCGNRIETWLNSAPGVEKAVVDFAAGTAALRYDPQVLSFGEIKGGIEGLGYRVLGDDAGTGAPAGELAGTLTLILALYVLLRALGIGNLAAAFPLAEAGMGYGMLFITGLVTSVHCAAMCGGINLSQCLNPAVQGKKRREALGPAVLYNAGRVISYSAAGVLAGGLGRAVSVSGRFQGLVQLAAGVFMVIMGINMLGFFPALRRFRPGLPRIISRKIEGQRARNRGPLFIGLLNGLMPCGPLQAMQIYALSTGSPLAGGIAMFLFSAGTVPLMFGLGALGSLLGHSAGSGFTRRAAWAGAVLITVMGLTMFGYGLNLAGFSLDAAGGALAALRFPGGAALRREAAPPALPPVEGGVQIVNSTLSGNRYPAITVRAGMPVRWIINAPAGSVNGCNNRMILREYGIEHRFRSGENVVEFSPPRTGKFSYSCWMGMIRGSITVVEPGAIPESPADSGDPGAAPFPAGVLIPTDRVALAELGKDGGQTVTISLRDGGIDPAILVLRRGIPALWIVNNDSLDPGNSSLIFPAYAARLDMEQGDNIIRLLPGEDFDFSTADNVFYGYVKVVDDLSAVDIEALRAEVLNHETLIYPEGYVEGRSGDASYRRRAGTLERQGIQETPERSGT
ncbi:MAG: sulfite exporter TauE/SafE family protein [Treponema sp.]|jgi:sulfite exporter TauE/SafE/copper chaperone CopZ/plastocyanin domain-containing protein|nr:sulfite exporter TauE/SafE family protein [Treponema sp.]